MRIKFSEITLKPILLISLWLIFFLSPLLSVFRFYFVVNNNFLGFYIKGFSSLLLYFPFFISVLVFLNLVLWFSEFIDNKLFTVHKKTLAILSLLNIVFLVAAGSLRNLEYRNYPNFLYGHFGITVSQLEFMSFVAALELIMFLFILAYDLAFKIRGATKWRSNIVATANTEKASLFLAVAGFSGLVILSGYTFLNLPLMIKQEKRGYDAKVGIVYKYLVLLSDHTPKNAKVIHPPQGEKWSAIGNQPLIRYFLYPRVLISGALLNNLEFAKTIADAYFPEIDPTIDSTHWPKIDTINRTIIFDEKSEIRYKKLETIFESEEGRVFRVLF